MATEAYVGGVNGDVEASMFAALIGLVIAVSGAVYLVSSSCEMSRRVLRRVLLTITLVELGVYVPSVLTVTIAAHHRELVAANAGP